MSTIWEVTESESDLFCSNESEDESDEDYGKSVEDDWPSLDDEWLSDEDGGKSPATSLHSLTQQEGLRLVHLRKHVNMLRQNVDNCDKEVNKLRDDVAACQQEQRNISAELMKLDDRNMPTTGLETSLDGGAKTGELSTLRGRTAGLGLLQGKRNKLKAQVYKEEEQEKNLKAALIAVEDKLLEAKMAAKEYEGLEEELEKGEAAMKRSKDRKLMKRLETEARLAATARRQNWSMKLPQSPSEEMIKDDSELEQQRQAAVQRVLARQRETQRKARVEHREHVEKRMNAILSLRKNISASEEVIQAQQLLHKERQQKREEEQKKRILEEGGDLVVETVRRQRMEQLQKKMADFQKKQEKGKIEIVAKLLKEEESIKQRDIPQDKVLVHQKKKKKRKKKEKIVKGETRNDASQHVSTAAEDTEGEELFNGTAHAADDQLAPETTQDDSVIMPAIRGLWEEGNLPRGQAGNPPAVWRPRSDSEGGDKSDSMKKNNRTFSTAEQRKMQDTMDKLRKGIIKKQVAAGREFKGVAFTSQPGVVLFQDFTVGQTYSRNVKLTNVSFTVNHCRLERISPSLVDMVSVHFDPPGSMSAGMTCHMVVTFQPQLEEDLDGDIIMLSETGPFNIPVRCRTKKCLVKLDHTHVNFGKVCVGEMVRRQITICSMGALPTNFVVSRSHAGKEPSMMVTEEKKKEEEKKESESREGKLAERSDLSLNSDLGTYGRLPEEMAMIGVAQELDRAKSRSVSDMGIICEGETRSEENQNNGSGERHGSGGLEDVHTTRDGQIHTTSEKRISGDSKLIEEGQSMQDGQVSMEGPTSSTDGVAREGCTAEKEIVDEGVVDLESNESSVQQHCAPTSGSGSTMAGSQAAPPTILYEGSSRGTLEEFSSQALHFTFSPVTPTRDSTEYFITFSHPTLDTVKVSLVGEGVDLPVFLEEEVVDFKICLVDRLYQCSVVLHNRGVTARQVTFKIPPELQSHLEVLPSYSLVQGNDSLSVQLKFSPGQSLLQSGPARDKFVGPDGRWKIAVLVEVGGQRLPVILTVLADVSPSALILLPEAVDFGSCTTQETVRTPLTLTNTSSLLQSFGFVHLPPCIDVQPGDGFGDILPGATVHLDLLFSPDKSKDYEFEVICKSLLNQTCKVQCRGRGVLSPMVLSVNHLIFPATRLGSTSRASFTLTNSKLSRLSSAVIRGTAPARGARAFQFSLPTGSPLSFSPHVGTLSLGQSVTIEVSFSPRVSTNMVNSMYQKRKEDMKMEEANKEHTLTSSEKETTDETKKSATHQAKVLSKTGKVGSMDEGNVSAVRNGMDTGSGSKKGAALPAVPERTMAVAFGSGAFKGRGAARRRRMCRSPTPGSSSWLDAYHSVLVSYKDQDFSLTIPCFISDTTTSIQTSKRKKGLKHIPEYTLYMVVAGKIVKPELVLARGQSSRIDFGQVVTGEVAKQQVTVMNTSADTLPLTSSLLDPLGPFSLRNALRTLPPHGTHTLQLHFTPQGGTKSYDTLVLYYGETKNCLELNLLGKGVPLHITMETQSPSAEGEAGESVPEELTCVDVGHVMAGDTASKTFSLHNYTPLPVRFSFSLASQLPENRHAKKLRGMCSSGRAAFCCVPSEGCVEGEQVKEVKVTFDPDRQSAHFTDTLLAHFNGKLSSSVPVVGQAWTNNMYVLLNDIDGGSCSSMDYLEPYASQRDTTESLLPPLRTTASSLSQTLVIMFSYNTSNSNVTKSSSSQKQPESHLNRATSDLDKIASDVDKGTSDLKKTTSDLDQTTQDQGLNGVSQLNRTKSEPPGTGTNLRKTLSLDLDESEEEQEVGYRREVVIGCIKSALVKKQSGEFVIDALNANTYPMAKCFTIDPLKASVEGGSTHTVTITFTPPKNVVSCVEANTTLTLKGDSTQTCHLCLRAVIAE